MSAIQPEQPGEPHAACTRMRVTREPPAWSKLDQATARCGPKLKLEILQNRQGRAKQRRATTQPTFGTTVLVSCYETTLLWRGAGVVRRSGCSLNNDYSALAKFMSLLTGRKDERHYDGFEAKSIALRWWKP